jgi:predicted 3-demethylubiquinone-9 3-methyltransferase (glyoxalase superfamily)
MANGDTNLSNVILMLIAVTGVKNKTYNRKERVMSSKISTADKARITPFLMFKENCVDAANFYVSLFEHSKILNSDEMSASFVLDGQQFHAFNGGEHFTFNEGISLFVRCESQQEVDFYWEKLCADGGAESQCGWLRDKFGVSWQIIPTVLMELLGDKDRDKANRAMQAMLKMNKIIIQALQDAANG